jgi:hypothetical protein
LYPELQNHFDTENVFDKNCMKVNMTSLLERSDTQLTEHRSLLKYLMKLYDFLVRLGSTCDDTQGRR